MSGVYDVIVIGAGVAGSAAAKAFAGRGWSTLLLDRHRFPRHKVCGEFLSPESQATLGRLGLLDDILSLSPSVMTGAKLHLAGGGVISLPLPGTALGLSRHRLDAALHRAAERAGAQVREGITILSIARQGDFYQISSRSGGQVSELRARAVVAAWGGANMPLCGLAQMPNDAKSSKPAITPRKMSWRGLKERARVSLLRPPLRDEYIGIKMHYAPFDGPGIKLHTSDSVELYFFRGGYVGLNAVEEGRMNVAALLDRNDIPASKRSVSDMLTEAANRHPRLQQRLSGMTALIETAAAVSPVRLAMRPTAWSGLPLIGDAICRIPPLCGDGMSMGLRSAELCAAYGHRYLQGELALEQWASEYERVIVQEFSGPLRWGRLAQKILGSPSLSFILPKLAWLAPGTAQAMVRATRLRQERVE